MDVARLNLSHGSYADHEEIYRRVREASDDDRSRRRHPRRPAGPEDPPRPLRRRPVELADRADVHHHHRRRRRRRTRSPARRTTACPATSSAGDRCSSTTARSGSGSPRSTATTCTPGRRRRPGQRPQGHQPARRRGQRPRAVGEGRRGPALGAAACRRLHRAVVRARGQGRRGRPRDHGRGGCPPAGHRQDREAAGGREPRRDHRGLRRLHGRARRPRRGVPLEHVPLVQKRVVETARRNAKPVIVATQMLESMITQPGAHPRRGLRRRQRGARRRRRGDALGRDQRRGVPDRGGARRWRGSSRRPRTTARTPSPPSLAAPHQGGAIAKAAAEVGELLGASSWSRSPRAATPRGGWPGYRGQIPLLAFTPEAGAQPARPDLGGRDVPGDVVEHTDDMVRQVDEQLLESAGSRWATSSSSSPAARPGIPGSTNALRVHRIGDAINAAAPGLPKRLRLAAARARLRCGFPRRDTPPESDRQRAVQRPVPVQHDLAGLEHITAIGQR